MGQPGGVFLGGVSCFTGPRVTSGGFADKGNQETSVSAAPSFGSEPRREGARRRILSYGTDSLMNNLVLDRHHGLEFRRACEEPVSLTTELSQLSGCRTAVPIPVVFSPGPLGHVPSPTASRLVASGRRGMCLSFLRGLPRSPGAIGCVPFRSGTNGRSEGAAR